MTPDDPNTFGRYRLHRRLARGGMAEIFLAEQHAAEDVWKPVVIKRILPHLAEERSYVTMFLDEARIASRFALDVPQSGDVRMWSAWHLARVLDELGDADGAARACEQVLYPRRYLTYRGVLYPDCVVWTAEVAPADEAEALYRHLNAIWRGDFVHDAVEVARHRLTGDPP